ncbi:MAG: recombinase family protein [Clostridia bacterium]
MPNEETAPIVQKIFEMLKIGTLPTDVAQWLNDNNVPVPSESVGNAHTRRYNEVKRRWNRTAVIRIARDRTYLGYVINGKSRKVSYKSKKVIQVPTEEYIEIKGMHEPLVDQETFDIVQRMIDSRKKTRLYKHDFLLKGLLECAECGKKLSVLTQKQKSGNVIQYLRCNTYASMTRLKLCTPHSNNCEKLTNEVIKTIKARCKKYLKEEELFQLAKKVKDSNTYKKNLIQNQIATAQGKVELMNKKIDQLYEDKLNGIINVDDFERMYTSTLDRKKELEELVLELQKQKEETSHEVDLKKEVSDFIRARKITREMIVSLVDRITVSESKEIKIYYKFSILNESSEQDGKVVDIRDCVNF